MFKKQYILGYKTMSMCHLIKIRVNNQQGSQSRKITGVNNKINDG